jgi:hypothetical protein
LVSTILKYWKVYLKFIIIEEMLSNHWGEVKYETPGNIYFKDIKSIAWPRLYNISTLYVETKRELVSTILKYWKV